MANSPLPPPPPFITTFLSTFAVLAVVYVLALALVWRVFDGQKGKAEPESGANGCGCGASGSGDGAAAGGMMGRAEDESEMGRDGGGDNVLPPLGDLALGDEEAFADESHPQSQPKLSQANHRRRGVSFVDKLDDALSRPLPQRHRAPPRPSMDLIPQQLVEIDRAREEDGDETPVPPRGRSRRMRRAQQSAPSSSSPSMVPPQHMDEVVRDMNSKSGISRMAAPEAKVVYPNADATYGAEPTAQAPQANSIMLSAEQRIMLAHRASTGQ